MSERLDPGAGLLPCPFCGGVDVEIDWNRTHAYAICRGCGAFGPEAEVAMTADSTAEEVAAEGRKAVPAWNRRAEVERLRAVVAAQAATIARLGRVAEAARHPDVIEALRREAARARGYVRLTLNDPERFVAAAAAIDALLSAIDDAGAAGEG